MIALSMSMGSAEIKNGKWKSPVTRFAKTLNDFTKANIEFWTFGDKTSLDMGIAQEVQKQFGGMVISDVEPVEDEDRVF